MTLALEFDSLARLTAARAAQRADLTGALERDDLLQEARLQILELERRHDSERAPLGAWLVASLPWALHRSIRRATPYRRSHRTQVYSVPHDELPDLGEALEESWAAAIDAQAILRQLTPEHRSVLWMFYGEQHTAFEVAAALRMSPRDADALIKRALRAARAIVAGRTAPDDDADTALLLEALQEGAERRGRLPGRAWVCKRSGLSELRYHRLMRRLVADGRIVGRSPRSPGYLAGEGGQAA
jgi:RNA polymerase sigma factor (sigma-70 family)